MDPNFPAINELPQWLLPYLSADVLLPASRPDAIVYCYLESRMAIEVTTGLLTLHAGMCTSLMSKIVMTHNQSNEKQKQMNSI